MKKRESEDEVLDHFIEEENSLNEVADLIKFQFNITRNPECSRVFFHLGLRTRVVPESTAKNTIQEQEEHHEIKSKEWNEFIHLFIIHFNSFHTQLDSALAVLIRVFHFL